MSSTQVGFRIAQLSILTGVPAAAFSTASTRTLIADSELLSADPYLLQYLDQ